MIPLVLVLTAAAPASAQTPPFSIEATEACLAAAADASDRLACVGRSAEACMAAEGGASTAGMGFCLDAEARYWDGRLNAAYAALSPREERADRDNAAAGWSPPSAAAALRDMQRAWIGYRDAACAYEAARWGGGTGAGPARLQCLMAATGAQALELEDRLTASGN